MKIAYLILAHSNYEHLEKLIRQIHHPEDRIFVHVDKKAGPLPTICKDLPGVEFLKKRVKSNWVSYSTVRAINVLLEHAYKHADADYFITLSGGDFPLRRTEELKAFLSRGGEYINTIKGTTETRPDVWYNKFYFECDRRARTHPVTRLYKFIEHYLHKIHTKRIPFQLYTGLDWFAISRKAVGCILDAIADPRNPYDKFFRNTYGTSESYYQTILGNSGSWEFHPSLTYTDWSKPEKPAYIDEDHVDFLKANPVVDSPYGQRHVFFARKFHNGSAPVVDKIIKEILTPA